MQFTEDQVKLLAKLRKRQKSWQRRRWLCLIGGVFSTLLGIWFIFEFSLRASATEKWDGSLVWLAPVPWVFYFQGLVICVFTLSRWRGDPVLGLILTLVELNAPIATYASGE